MQKKTLYYALPMFGNVISADCYSMGQLISWFQIECRKHGLTDRESLAVAVWERDHRAKTYFPNKAQMEQLARSGYAKIDFSSFPTSIPDPLVKVGFTMLTVEPKAEKVNGLRL